MRKRTNVAAGGLGVLGAVLAATEFLPEPIADILPTNDVLAGGLGAVVFGVLAPVAGFLWRKYQDSRERARERDMERLMEAQRRAQEAEHRAERNSDEVRTMRAAEIAALRASVGKLADEMRDGFQQQRLRQDRFASEWAEQWQRSRHNTLEMVQRIVNNQAGPVMGALIEMRTAMGNMQGMAEEIKSWRQSIDDSHRDIANRVRMLEGRVGDIEYGLRNVRDYVGDRRRLPFDQKSNGS